MLSRALSAVIVVEMIFASILVTCRHHNVANVGTQGLVTIVLDGQELDAVFLEVQTLQHEDLCAFLTAWWRRCGTVRLAWCVAAATPNPTRSVERQQELQLETLI